MATNVLVIAAGICGGLVIVFLLVVSARVFVTRRRVSALMRADDVGGLRDMAISSQSATARAAAVEALGDFGAHECLEPLVEALSREKDPAVRMLILETITSFGQRAAGPLLRSWDGLEPVEKAGVVLSLKALGKEPLAEALAHVAAGEPELLTPLLDQSDEAVRKAALKASLSPAGTGSQASEDEDTQDR